jgi:hypothetical protein
LAPGAQQGSDPRPRRAACDPTSRPGNPSLSTHWGAQSRPTPRPHLVPLVHGRAPPAPPPPPAARRPRRRRGGAARRPAAAARRPTARPAAAAAARAPPVASAGRRMKRGGGGGRRSAGRMAPGPRAGFSPAPGGRPRNRAAAPRDGTRLKLQPVARARLGAPCRLRRRCASRRPGPNPATALQRPAPRAGALPPARPAWSARRRREGGAAGPALGAPCCAPAAGRPGASRRIRPRHEVARGLQRGRARMRLRGVPTVVPPPHRIRRVGEGRRRAAARHCGEQGGRRKAQPGRPRAAVPGRARRRASGDSALPRRRVARHRGRRASDCRSMLALWNLETGSTRRSAVRAPAAGRASPTAQHCLPATTASLRACTRCQIGVCVTVNGVYCVWACVQRLDQVHWVSSAAARIPCVRRAGRRPRTRHTRARRESALLLCRLRMAVCWVQIAARRAHGVVCSRARCARQHGGPAARAGGCGRPPSLGSRFHSRPVGLNPDVWTCACHHYTPFTIYTRASTAAHDVRERSGCPSGGSVHWERGLAKASAAPHKGDAASAVNRRPGSAKPPTSTHAIARTET